ncbi:hypothetical protein BG004_003457 [Podila humilis]|nr:hypothetical protein BG004_003457 [Podila humilis]
MIRSRIGIRLIAEQVISLQEQVSHTSGDSTTATTILANKESGREKNSAVAGAGAGAGTGTGAESVTTAAMRDVVVGVVHRELKPAELIRTCARFVQELCDVNYGSSPQVVVNGQTDTTFTYVPVHLEYILCELLKNAVRATVEHSAKMGRSALNPQGIMDQSDVENLVRNEGSINEVGEGSHNNNNNKNNKVAKNLYHEDIHGGNMATAAAAIVKDDLEQDETRCPNEHGHPPVEVTIAQGEREITIRIRDQGGGITREDFDVIFDYSFTTVKNENDGIGYTQYGGREGAVPGGGGGGGGGGRGNEGEGGGDSIFKGVSRLAMQAGLGGPIAGLGFGLPLTRIYAQYFGGDMHLISLQGYGCDVFLKLKQIDESLNDLQI